MLGRKPTRAEKAWIESIVDLGCCVCRKEMGIYSPASVHHINGSRKEGCHLETIPLCFEHHQGGKNDNICVSRHPFRAEFERRYGTEQELLEYTRSLINQPEAASGCYEPA